MQIASIMKPIKQVLRPTDDLEAARRIMEDEKLTLLPVCSADNVFIGVIDRQHMEQALDQALTLPLTTSVETLISHDSISCTDTDDVMIVAEKASERDLSQSVVMDEQGVLIGVADLTPYQKPKEPNNGQQDSELNDSLDNTLDDTFPASDPVPPP